MGNVPAQKELESIRILASAPGSVRYEIYVPDNVLNYHGCVHGLRVHHAGNRHRHGDVRLRREQLDAADEAVHGGLR